MASDQHSAQSFLLRFWYEHSDFDPGHWRGTVGHMGQDETGHPRAVASPEDAFRMVRQALMAATDAMEHIRSGRSEPRDSRSQQCPIVGLHSALAAAFRSVFSGRRK